jgi:hypothetical protein
MERKRLRRLAAGALAVATIGGTGGTAVALAYTGTGGDGGPGVLADTFTMPAAGIFASRQEPPDLGRGPGRLGLHRRLFSAGLSAAASYLGLSQSELATQLRSGKTLAQIAAATPGKSAAGLVDALVAATTTKLDAAVKAGRLTPALEQTILAKLRAGVTALVDGTIPKLGRPWWGAPRGGSRPGLLLQPPSRSI